MNHENRENIDNDSTTSLAVKHLMGLAVEKQSDCMMTGLFKDEARKELVAAVFTVTHPTIAKIFESIMHGLNEALQQNRQTEAREDLDDRRN